MQTTVPQWTKRFQAIAAQANQDDGAHDLQHLNRVWHTAQILLDATPHADPLVVEAACFLHDLVNLPKNHPQRAHASRLAAQAARRELQAIGFWPEKLDAVAHAIEAHSFSAAVPVLTIEAKIVQDADRLDALGAIGLARLFYTAGRMGSGLAHPTDPMGKERILDDQAYAFDHIIVKLSRLPASMQTDSGRALGFERLAFLQAFRRQFCAEWK